MLKFRYKEIVKKANVTREIRKFPTLDISILMRVNPGPWSFIPN